MVLHSYCGQDGNLENIHTSTWLYIWWNSYEYLLARPHPSTTLSLIFMVQWKITLNERTLYWRDSFSSIFHFQDYGRKGIYYYTPFLALTFPQADQCKDDAARQKGKTEAQRDAPCRVSGSAEMPKDGIGSLSMVVPLFTGFLTSQVVVGDFFHEEHHGIWNGC